MNLPSTRFSLSFSFNFTLLLCLSCILLGASKNGVSSNPRRQSPPISKPQAPTLGRSSPLGEQSKATTVLILDVDGCLYDGQCGLEQEIASSIQSFCQVAYGISAKECDELHKKYGSTIEGLRIIRGLPDSELQAFYQTVYQGLNVDRILTGEGGDASGYSHSLPLLDLLKAHQGPIWVASNSPLVHVQAVISRLGLSSYPFNGILTPDILPDFPTKTNPAFWSSLLKAHPPESHHLILIDDSDANLAAAAKLGIRGIKVGPPHEGGQSFDRALAASLGAIAGIREGGSWRFDDVAYLAAKNKVDAKSMNQQVLIRLEAELKALRSRERPSPSGGAKLRVRDLGAGLLSMLEPTLALAHRGGWTVVDYEAFEINSALLGAARKVLLSQGYQANSGGLIGNEVLVRLAQADSPAVRVWLRAQYFGDAGGRGKGGGSRDGGQQQGGGGIEAGRGQENENEFHQHDPHLLIGCCLADLYEPKAFVTRLLRSAKGNGRSYPHHHQGNRPSCMGPLVYLPVTFSGQTALSPSSPESGRVPSDTTAMAVYHESLVEQQGHNLDPQKLIAALENHGAALLTQGPSNWFVKRHQDAYLWECLVHFFGLGLLPKLGPQGWDIRAWRQRLLKHEPDIEVLNVDLLFRLNDWTASSSSSPSSSSASSSSLSSPCQQSSSTSASISPPFSSSSQNPQTKDKTKKNVYIEFVGPRHVRWAEEAWSSSSSDDSDKPLGPTELEVESVCSLISSGTELKVYRGDFDRESAVDVSIKGMDTERMDYPLRYGYSLVGRVIRCGSQVTNPEQYLGGKQLVFCFCPHASRAIVDQAATMMVPHGVDPQDAVYIPSVETALSLVQDARPTTGERVTVVGAGLIGLLVLSILSRLHLTTLRAVDPLPSRRALAKLIGASETLDPPSLSKLDEDRKADTSIEVSGVAAGLQTALDYTGYGGRVIIGSWYGNHQKPAALRLGLGFHRSHLRILVSQVSRVSTELQDRWSKARRFGVAWDLLKRIRPSKLLTSRVVPPQGVAEAFQALDEHAAETLAVLIDYDLAGWKRRERSSS